MTPHRIITIISLGCAKNLVDTEVMAGTLALAGFQLAADAADADLLLINTCSFVADARAEAEAQIGRALEWKRGRRGRRLIVAGCLPQRDLPAARAKFPGVDLFIGLDDVPRVHELLGALLAGEPTGREADVLTHFALPRYLYDEHAPRLLLTPQVYAYVKIAEGCDHGCRFCSIPRIRGRQRSRTMDSVLAECRQLLGQGVREINLIAQDSTAYGRDLRDGSTLAELLRRLDAIEADFWLRVLYTHPSHITDEFLGVLAAARHIVPYLDVPLQHISDTQLRAMGRGHGGAAIRRLAARFRETVPGVAVRTTFIVGYPGESAADFAELETFVREYRFDRLGVFVFSPEAGTPAADIAADLVPAAVAQERRDRLMQAQQEISLARNQALIGSRQRVLLEAVSGKNRLAGRTAADAPEVDNLVTVTGRRTLLAHGFADVTITGAGPYDLTAAPVTGSA